ncbi:glycosyltransferase [Vagococcus fluvialis]|uniref:glycosyltransferase n=1 Tax=Vagococcus fluvialis TaxID=2738 RepID=UPI003B59F453
MNVLILTTIKAPYRVNLFSEIGKKVNLRVCFEQKHDSTRENSWYINNNDNYETIELKGWEKPLFIPRLQIFSELKKKTDYVILYEYSTITSILVALYCIVISKPYFINCDGATETSPKLRDLVKKVMIKHATGLLANGKSAEKYFLRYGAKPEKINKQCFSNHFSFELTNTFMKEKEKNNLKGKLNISDEKIILTVGRLEKIKGIDILIKAWEYVDSDVNLYIIGSGIEESNYKKMIEKYSNIKMFPHMNKEKLDEFYKISDIFVIPSRGDVWGLVVNEAMSFGLPIISSNMCNAGLELIEDGENGYLIDNDIPKNYADVVNQLIKNSSLMESMGKNNLAKISTFSFENESETIIKFIGEVN